VSQIHGLAAKQNATTKITKQQLSSFVDFMAERPTVGVAVTAHTRIKS